MKVMNIALMILRTAVLLALILGIIFWINPALPQQSEGIKDVHMALGFIVVLALWAVGLAQGFVRGGGNFGLALVTFVVGLAVAIVGSFQINWKDAGANVELINTIHLLLGLIAIGCGEMVAGRTKRLARAQASANTEAGAKA